MAERIGHIDTAKGILIILVVLVHSMVNYSDYISWFHMPAFFIISGYIFNDIGSVEILKSKIKSRAKGYLIPYFAYGILFAIGSFTVLKAVDAGVQWSYLFNDLFNLLYGGAILRGPYSVFWFLNVLFLTYALFAFLNYLKLNRYLLASIVFVSYVIAHILFDFGIIGDKFIPWNLESLLMTLFYFYIGYSIRIDTLSKKNTIALFWALSVMSGIFIWLASVGYMNYLEILKYSYFNHIFLDGVIPVLMSYNLIFLCKLIENGVTAKILSHIGKNSIIIYFLHFPLNQYLVYFADFHYGSAIFTLIGVVIPLIIALFISKSKTLSLLFLGTSIPPQ